MNVFWFVGASFVFLLIAISLVSYVLDTATPEEKRILAYRLHVLLPRFITKQKWFQEFHYQAVWNCHLTMFWARCFPNDHHRWIDLGVGLHCQDCEDWVGFTGNTMMISKFKSSYVLKWLL